MDKMNKNKVNRGDECAAKLSSKCNIGCSNGQSKSPVLLFLFIINDTKVPANSGAENRGNNNNNNNRGRTGNQNVSRASAISTGVVFAFLFFLSISLLH
jgi:hypothetical protein